MTEYRRLLRMDEDCFNFLLEALRPDMFAGESQISIYDRCRISQPVVGHIVRKVSKAILRRLSPEFVTVCIL